MGRQRSTMIPPHNSLVKYDNPVLVSTSKDKKGKGKDKGKGGKKLAPLDSKPQLTQTEDILNSILPPREWTEDGQLWVQFVSSTPATRLDVINLQEDLDKKLQQRQARETGICPVRDEIRMTIAAYQTLYESSVAFGMRKALQAEQGKADMEQRIKTLEQEKKDLERQVQESKSKCEQIEKREAERRTLEEKKHKEEVEFLKKTNAQLKQNLENLLAPSKKG